MLRGVQHKMFSRSFRTSLDKLLNKIDCSSALKDGKIKAIHDLLEQQQTLRLLVVLVTQAWKQT